MLEETDEDLYRIVRFVPIKSKYFSLLQELAHREDIRIESLVGSIVDQKLEVILNEKKS